MVADNQCYAFQADSEVVRQAYSDMDNFLIEYDENQGGGENKRLCAVYFSSNDIYYPNTEEIFRKRILGNNFFEWYHSRITKARKHIFVRDIFKQWYLAGINANIDSPDKLASFLKKETEGYDVVTIGSSAGGYAAILYGSLIGAKTAIVFNPQFEIASLLERSTESVNPLVFRLKDLRREYYDIVQHINRETDIFYFHSLYSQWDIEQKKHIRPMPNLHEIPFQTKHHGIPFLKAALPTVINSEPCTLECLENKKHNPILFTIKMAGLRKAVTGAVAQIYLRYKKRR